MRWLVIALLLPLAGCVGLEADGDLMPEWSRHSCDPTSAEASGNAPVRPPFDGDEAELIARLEKALGIDVPAEPAQVHEGAARYDLPDGGSLTIDTSDVPRVAWVHPTPWPGPGDGHANMERALRDLGMWGSEMEIDGDTGNLQVRQVRAGSNWVAGALWNPEKYAQSGWYSSLDIRPAYTLSAQPGPASEAEPVAQAFADCIHEDERPGPWQVRSQPHLSVQHQSLAWTFIADGPPDPEHHCGGLAIYVHVDAETQAVHGWDWVGCD